MPLKIIRDDITKLECDAIVNAANNTLLGGGGVDGAIHAAAGKELKEYCSRLGGCKTGEAKITPGFQLKCKYIIHTVGPVWHGGVSGEEEALRSCYRNSLALAEKNNVNTIAFPLISAGAYGYPKDQAVSIANEEITEFLKKSEMTVYIVVFDKAAFEIGKTFYDEVREYIDQQYVDNNYFPETRRLEYPPRNFMKTASSAEKAQSAAPSYDEKDEYLLNDTLCMDASAPDLDSMLGKIDESFSQMLLRKIDERGMTDAECYKKANVDRKLFSKIRNSVDYKPKKVTAIAFAIALELDIDETKELLMKAGYALSHSNKFDIIIEYFIISGNYNIFEINETLFAFDQVLLGV